MTTKLHRMIYTSHCRINGDVDEVAAEIQSILASARRNNPRRSLTGALVFNSGFFAQVLEGPRGEIEGLFKIIKNDPRHSDVKVLIDAQVSSRAFPHWSMAYVGESPRWENVFAPFRQDPTALTDQLEGEKLFLIMMQMAYAQEPQEP